MTPEQFCYWLRGSTELSPVEQPSPEQWRVIQEHLELVFLKLTTQVVIRNPGHQVDLTEWAKRFPNLTDRITC